MCTVPLCWCCRAPDSGWTSLPPCASLGLSCVCLACLSSACSSRPSRGCASFGPTPSLVRQATWCTGDGSMKCCALSRAELAHHCTALRPLGLAANALYACALHRSFRYWAACGLLLLPMAAVACCFLAVADSKRALSRPCVFCPLLLGPSFIASAPYLFCPCSLPGMSHPSSSYFPASGARRLPGSRPPYLAVSLRGIVTLRCLFSCCSPADRVWILRNGHWGAFL